MLGTTAGKRSRECQQFSSPCCRFVSAQLLLLFFFSPCTCFRLFESYVFSSSWLQGYGLEEGTDPCVFYTQLTKLLNLIALLGIILFCGKLTLFLLICVVFLIYFFFFSLMIKCCEIDFFLWHMWHAGQVPSYKRTPLTRKRDTFHSNAAPLAPFRRTEIDSVFAKFVILLEEEFLRTNLSWKPFRTKNTSVLSKKKKKLKLKSWYVSGALGPSIYLLAGPVIFLWAPTAKTTRWLCVRKMQT